MLARRKKVATSEGFASVRAKFALAALALTVPGCGGFPPLRAVPPASARAPGAGGLLQGRLEVPPALRLLATSTDVAAYAALVLRNAAGDILASGTTDTGGLFELPRLREGASLQNGQVYTLEAVKRVDGALMAMRTVLVREADAWRSPTGASIALNMATTTLATLYERNDATLTPADLLDTVTAGVVTSPIGPFGTADVAQLQASMTTALAEGLNPSGRLGQAQIVSVSSQADLDRIAAYTEALAIVVFNPPGVTEIKLPNLKHCQALLVAGSLDLERIELPALEECPFFLIQAVPKLTEIKMPRLRSWGGFNLASADALGSLVVSDELTWTPFTQELKDTVLGPLPEQLVLQDGKALTALALPPSALPPQIVITGCPVLASLGLAAWSRTDYQLIQLYDDPALADVSALAAVTHVDQLALSGMPLLGALPWPALASVGSGSLGPNLPLLSLCDDLPWLSAVSLTDVTPVPCH